jgi:hypothetical protein
VLELPAPDEEKALRITEALPHNTEFVNYVRTLAPNPS